MSLLDGSPTLDELRAWDDEPGPSENTSERERAWAEGLSPGEGLRTNFPQRGSRFRQTRARGAWHP